jgi:hexosaminidase
MDFMKTVPALLLSVLAGLTIPGPARKSQEATTKMETRNLTPVPASVSFQPGRLTINESFTIFVSGGSDQRLDAAIERALRRLERRTAIDRRPEMSSALNQQSATLVIRRQSAGKAFPDPGEDESYKLEVTDKQAALSAPTTSGALRGLETFLQLIEGDRSGYYVPAVRIDDRPRFSWRGLMIDVCRHWMPIDVIKRNLDGMAAVKLNVFHWHLTDDQGFRVESRKFPKLHGLGSDGNYYTQEQIKEVIAYAAARGMRVVPEFDMPGHATAWLTGYPELGSAPGPYQIERKWGIHKPALDPSNEAVYKFLDTFLGEMAALFPDPYLHIGGDEVEPEHWKQNTKIQTFMMKEGVTDAHALQAYFNRRVNTILKKHGKKMIGWDEILHPSLPNDIVVHSWRGQKSLAEAAKKGYAGILSSGYYLDHVLPAETHYLNDPVPADSNLGEAGRARILGGEACMWSEYVSHETIDSRIWPRLAAIAERLWSPRSVHDVDDLYRRLAVISVQLEEHGLTHEKHTAAMLRRLAQTSDIEPLKTLAAIVEPIRFLQRYNARQYTQQTPLTRFVDAAKPDSANARSFARLVSGLLDDAPRFHAGREALAKIFTQWRDDREMIRAVISRSPALAEIEPLADDLSELGKAGLAALGFLAEGKVPPQDWFRESMEMTERAARPRAEVEIVTVQPVRHLLIAAWQLEQLKSLSVAEWKRLIIDHEIAARTKPEKK